MKKTFIAIAIAAATVAASSCSTGSAPAPKTQNDSLSYAFGVDYGSYLVNMQNQLSDEIAVGQVQQAIKDVLNDKGLMTSEDAYNFLSNYFTNVFPQRQKEAESEYLASIVNSNKKAVKTDSGLIYEIIEPGKDAKPTEEDTVKVNYKGMLKDGTIFDQTEDEPISFPLNGVISGWTEGLQLIGEGGKIKLWIPSELAYGANGTPDGSIGQYQPLQFEVELLEINPSEDSEE